MLPDHGAAKRRWMPVSLLVLVVAAGLFGAASAYGDGNVTVMTQNLYQGTDNLTWIRGNHTFKFGADYAKYISPQLFIQRARIAAVVTAVIGLVLILALPELPGTLVAHGRWAVTWLGKTEMLYVGEGMHGDLPCHLAGRVDRVRLRVGERLDVPACHSVDRPPALRTASEL